MPGTYDKTYPNIKDLDLIPVHSENGAAYFKVNKLPESLSYGKHYFLLSWFGDDLKDGSTVNFEFKDSKGNTIFSDISDYNIINGSVVCYVWLKKDPLRINDEIADGLGTLTIVGELQSVPERWVGVPNVRYKIPISIEKNTPNTSNIVFDNPSNIQANSSFSETQLNDTIESGTPFYKRSYLVVSASHMEVISGKVNFIEVSYREIKSKTSDFKVISTYPITGSPYEVTESAASGLNPLSNQAKVLLPRDIRRNSEIEFKLRFIDGQGRYAQDLTSKTEKDIVVTGSLSSVVGSPIIVETSDNLVKGDDGGSFIFGSSLDNGFRLDFKDENSGKFKGENTLEFTPIKNGRDQKPFAFAEKGEFVNDIDTNQLTESRDASIIGSVSSSISSSVGGVVIGASSSKIINTGLSTIIGGKSNIITNPEVDNSLSITNIIAGGVGNQMTASQGGSVGKIGGSVIIGGATNTLAATGSGNNVSNTVIVGGILTRIEESDRAFTIGGFQNRIATADDGGIIGGTGNTVSHSNSVIIGMSGKHTEDSNTVYIQNLDVAGSMTVNELTSSIVSSSTSILIENITSSGDSIFGNEATDTHTFFGDITASGNISASNILLPPLGKVFLNSTTDTDDYLTYSSTFDSLFIQSQDINLNPINGVGINRALNYNNTATLDVDGNINTTSHITASGNISSSGTIIGSNISGTNTGNVTLAGSRDYLTISGQEITRNELNVDADTNLNVADTTGQTGIDLSLSSLNGRMTAVVSGLTTTSDVQFNHITASGNISGSSTSTLSIGNTIAIGSAGSQITTTQLFLAHTGDDVLLKPGQSGLDDGQAQLLSHGSLSVILDTQNSGTQNYFNIKKDSLAPNTATEIFRIDESGNITGSADISASGFLSAKHLILSGGSGVFTSASLAAGGGGGGAVSAVTNGSDNRLATFSSGNALNGEENLTFDGSTLEVVGNITASGDLFKTKFVQMTNSSSVIDTFNTGSFRSAKYTLQVTSASKYQVSEMLVLHNDGTALNTEYAQINSGTNLIDFSTDVNGSNLRLNASGDFISCSVRYDRTIIPI